eukprot:gb/GECG01001467.1/.p1 GENE.gb/GECG01001467.1/~~gb/GECG01001467.1/.p1  ORF type:complete len:1052 (+),score=178.54 gb/GECG01001467.1/:1-3156(+)
MSERRTTTLSPASADGASSRHRARNAGNTSPLRSITHGDGSSDTHDVFLQELEHRTYVESVHELSRESLEKQVQLLQRYASLLDETRNRQIKEHVHKNHQLEHRYQAKVESYENALQDERKLTYQLGQTCQDIKQDKERLTKEVEEYRAKVEQLQQSYENEKEEIKRSYQQKIDSQKEQLEKICTECEEMESKLATLRATFRTSGNHPLQSLAILSQGRCGKLNQCVIQEGIPSQLEQIKQEVSEYRELVQQRDEQIYALERKYQHAPQCSNDTATAEEGFCLEIQRPHSPEVLLESLANGNNESTSQHWPPRPLAGNYDHEEMTSCIQDQVVDETQRLREKLQESEQIREEQLEELRRSEYNEERLREQVNRQVRQLEKTLQGTQRELRDVRSHYSTLDNKLHDEKQRARLQERHNQRLNEQIEALKNCEEENKELRKNLKSEVSYKHQVAKKLRQVLEQVYQLKDGTLKKSLQNPYERTQELRAEVENLSQWVKKLQGEEKQRINWYMLRVSDTKRSFDNQINGLVDRLCSRNRISAGSALATFEDTGTREVDNWMQLQHAVAIHHQNMQRYEDEQHDMISKQQELQKRIDSLVQLIDKLKSSWYVKRSENDTLTKERDKMYEKINELNEENARLREPKDNKSTKKSLSKKESMKQLSLENENTELRENLQTLRDLYTEVVRNKTDADSWEEDLREMQLSVSNSPLQQGNRTGDETVVEDLRYCSSLFHRLYTQQYDWKHASDMLESIVRYCKGLADVASQGKDIRSLYGEVVFVIAEVESTYDYMCRRKVDVPDIEALREQGIFTVMRLLEKTGEGTRKSPLDEAITMFSDSAPPSPDPVYSTTSQVFGLYREACEHNVTEAYFRLGRMYHFGEAVERDTVEAAIWYEKAVAMGNHAAENNLARLCESGDGVTQDVAKAFELYSKAAEGGHAAAQYNLAALYESGKATEQDMEKAFELFQEAASSSVEAQFKVGWMLEQGSGISQNIDEAINFYKQSASHGLLNAQYNLGVLYEKSKADFDNAVRYYTMAAAAGDSDAHEALLRLSDN